MTYGRLEVMDVNLRTLALGEACPASLGPPTRKAKPQLDRWKLIADLCYSWLLEEDKSEESARRIADQSLSWVDPVQRGLIEGAFASFRFLFPETDPTTVEIGPIPAAVLDGSETLSVTVHGQFAIAEPDEAISVFRLKTGSPRRGSAYVTTEEELAVIAQEDGQRMFQEVRTKDGVVEPLSHEEEGTAVIAQIFQRHQVLAARERVREPGLHCLDCERPSTCGQYPGAGSAKPSARNRAVVVTKSRLPVIDQCERRVAWRVLYGIPRDDGHDADHRDTRSGRHFHEAIAAALISSDPDDAFRTAVMSMPESESSDLLSYWDQHLRLVGEEAHPVTVRFTEYPVGATWVLPGPDVNSRTGEIREDLVAVVLLGFTDAVGREASGLPAVVDHKTGGDGIVPYEKELYAVGTARLLNTDQVAVHRHQLTLGRDPVCERVVFDETKLETARELLAERGARIAAWHPTNSLDPTFHVNPSWCGACEFRERCENYR